MRLILRTLLSAALLAALGSGCVAPLATDDITDTFDPIEERVPVAYAAGKLHSDLSDDIVSNLHAIHARGDHDDDAFMKVGDSMTFSTDFLQCFATTPVNATGSDIALEQTRTSFAAKSWSRTSTASKVGWHTDEPLRGSPRPIDLEIEHMKPAFAVVMLGTNDTYAGSESSYRRNLQALVSYLAERGIVPILSTLPPRASASANAIVPRMNAVVRQVAAASKVPLVDLHLALADLPGAGLSRDGIHPFAAGRNACDFSERGLRGGYNQRNLLTLQALDRVRRAVELDVSSR